MKPASPVPGRDGSPIRAVLFDLDGTLADTAPDLLFALNRVIGEEGGEPLPLAEIHPLVSQGSRAMLQRAIARRGPGMDPDSPGFTAFFTALTERFLAIYRANIAVRTRLFPGMGEVLARIEAESMIWGVVTNKSGWLTEPLMTALGLVHRAACIVSGDTTEYRKPHPDPLLLACDRIGIAPARCLYVGDAAKDVEAGQRAGMRTGVALFGYIARDEHPEAWGADYLFPSPRALCEFLEFREAEPCRIIDP